MKHSTWFRMACLLLATAGALLTARPVLANPIVPFTLAFEREGLDLDTGTIVPIELWTFAVESVDPQPDLVLGYNSERTVCAVVFRPRTAQDRVAPDVLCVREARDEFGMRTKGNENKVFTRGRAGGEAA